MSSMENFNKREQQTSGEFSRTEDVALKEASLSLLKQHGDKLGKLKKLATIFGLATVLTLYEREPENTPSTDSMPTKLEQLDPLTKSLIENIIKNHDIPYVGELVFGNIESADEAGSGDGKTQNKSAGFHDDMRGTLPPQAEKVIIRGGTIANSYSGQTNESVAINSSTRSVFVMSGVLAGFDVVPVGEKFSFTGFGVSPANALQSGLEDAAGFYGTRVSTDLSLERKINESKKGSSFSESLNHDTQSLRGQAFYSYQSSEPKKRPDGMWEVDILAQPGMAIETNDGRIKIIEKPKD